MRSKLAVNFGALVLCTALGCASQKGQVSASDVDLGAPRVVAQDGSGPNSPKEQLPDINPRAKMLFDDALKSYEAQKKAHAFDYPALKKKFKAALDADPKFAEADYNLGVISERMGDKAAAIAHYKSALKRRPTLRQAAENLGVIAQNNGDVDAAVTIYKDILDNFPDDAGSRARLAEIYRQNGDHERALQFAREALIRDPKTLAAYKVMMLSHLDRKQLAMAKLVALRAMKIDENDPELYHTVGLILMGEGQPDKAHLQFKRALEVRPDYLPAHMVMAKLLIENEDFPGAEAHLRRILQADGKNAEAHLNLGVAYKGMGQYDKAMQQYDEAEKLNPGLAQVVLNRAIILHRHKDAPERALEMYKKYLGIAGGEGLGADEKVFALVKEAEQIIAAKEEMKRQEEEMKRAEAEQKKQEAEAKKQKEVADAEAKAQEEQKKKEKAALDAEDKRLEQERKLAKGVGKDKAPEKKAPAPAKDTRPAKGQGGDESLEPGDEEPSL